WPCSAHPGLPRSTRPPARGRCSASTARRSPSRCARRWSRAISGWPTASTTAFRCCWSRKASPPARSPTSRAADRPTARRPAPAPTATGLRMPEPAPQSALDPPDAALVESDVARALAEDIGDGDATAGLLPDRPDRARLLCKEPALVCGRPWFDACHRALDPTVRIDWHVAEGQRVAAGTVLATLHGRARALVTAERTSLNFLQTLSGTATATAA